jgi:hypothetical protein
METDKSVPLLGNIVTDNTFPFLGKIVEVETVDNRDGFFRAVYKSFFEKYDEPLPGSAKIYTKVKIEIIDPFSSNYKKGDVVNYETKLGSVCEKLVLPKKDKVYVVVFAADNSVCRRFLWETEGDYIINDVGRLFEYKTEKISIKDFKASLKAK